MKKAAPWIVAVIAASGITYGIGMKVATDRYKYLIDSRGSGADCKTWIVSAIQNSRSWVKDWEIRPEEIDHYANFMFEGYLDLGVYTEGTHLRRVRKVPVPKEVCVFDYRDSRPRQVAVEDPRPHGPSPNPATTSPTPHTG